MIPYSGHQKKTAPLLLEPFEGTTHVCDRFNLVLAQAVHAAQLRPRRS